MDLAQFGDAIADPRGLLVAHDLLSPSDQNDIRSHFRATTPTTSRCGDPVAACGACRADTRSA
jgi:hypothetical protein